MSRLQGLLFDKDGVIVDFHKTWAPALMSFVAQLAAEDHILQQQLLEAAGFDVREKKFMAASVWAAGNTFDLIEAWQPLMSSGIDRERLASQIETHCGKQRQHGVLPDVELQALCSRLRLEDYQLGIATNDSETSARKALEVFGVSDHFSAVVGYDSVANPKPAADPVYKFCHLTGVRPERMAVIGDNLHDIEMAHRAGVAITIGVTSGTSNADDIVHCADHIIGTIADLPELLMRFEKNDGSALSAR